MSSATPLANFHLVDRAVGAALAAGAVVGDEHDDRVRQLVGLLEVVQQAPDVVVGVCQEPGVDLGHPGEQTLLLGAQLVPRNVFQPRSARISESIPFSGGMVPLALGNPIAASVMHAMLLRVWLRPVSRQERVGEQSEVVCHWV